MHWKRAVTYRPVVLATDCWLDGEEELGRPVATKHGERAALSLRQFGLGLDGCHLARRHLLRLPSGQWLQ